MRTPEQIIGNDRMLQLVFEGYMVVPIEPTDEMLNAAQSRLCEIANVTYFNDHHQAEMFKAMVAAAQEPT